MSEPVYTEEQLGQSLGIIQGSFVEAISEILDKETADKVLGLAGIKMLQATALVLQEAYAELFTGEPTGSLDNNPPKLDFPD